MNTLSSTKEVRIYNGKKKIFFNVGRGSNARGRAKQANCHFYSKNCCQKMILISSVTKSCWTLWVLMDCSMLGFLILHHLPEFAQTHVHRVGDTIQTSHPLSPPSPDLNLSQHHNLFQGVGSSHQVAKVLELQHQSFQ